MPHHCREERERVGVNEWGQGRPCKDVSHGVRPKYRPPGGVSHLPIAEAQSISTAASTVPSCPQPTCATTTSCSARTAAPASRTSIAPARQATPAYAASSPAVISPTTLARTVTARQAPSRAPTPCSDACCCWGWPPVWPAEPVLGVRGSRARRRHGCG